MNLDDLLHEAENIADRAFDRSDPFPSPDLNGLELGQAYLTVSIFLKQAMVEMNKHGIPGGYQIALVVGWLTFYAAVMTGQPWAIELRNRVISGEFGDTDDNILPAVLKVVVENLKR